MVKKELIMISNTHAREINPLGEKPDPQYYQWKITSDEFDKLLIKWKAVEYSLRTYVITLLHMPTDGDSDSYIDYGFDFYEYYPIGKKITADCNDDNLTCNILD